MTGLPEDNVVPLPNIMAINAHLYALFSPAFVHAYPDAWIEIAWGNATTGAVNQAATFSAMALKEASDFAVAKNRTGCNVYVGPALRQGAPGRGDRATDANYLASRYAWVDVDDGYDAVVRILQEQGLRPSIVLRTGSAPEPRLQIYFQLSESVDALTLRTLNAALHVLLPGSDSVGSPTHVMRLNGTINWPTAAKRARGYVLEVVGYDLPSEFLWRNAPSYTAAGLLAATGLDLASAKGAPAPTGDPWLDFAATASSRKGRNDDALLALLEASRVQGHWHNSIRDAIATMVGRGWEEAAIRLACAPYCQAGAGDKDLTPLIAGAFAKFGRTSPEGEEETPQPPPGEEEAAPPRPGQAASDDYELHWYKPGEQIQRAWLVDKLLPEKGAGLMSGQWGTGKSFLALDLAASVMYGLPFAGMPVPRRGGVLYVAAEAASEMQPRLKALIEHKLRPLVTEANAAAFGDLDDPPIAWIEEAPNLQSARDRKRLAKACADAAAAMMAKHGLPLALVLIDTLGVTGNFKDENDAAEGQKIMGALAELSRETSALVLALDHFGKVVETGTRGTSAKESSADAVIAVMGERVGGVVNDTRITLRKSRGSRTGEEIRFALRVVQVDALSGETSCVIDWAPRTPAGQQPSPAGKKAWRSKPLKVFRAALEMALAEHAISIHPFGASGSAVLAVASNFVRDEFLASYSVEGKVPGEGRKVDAKRKAYGRAIDDARDLRLIGFRETGAEPYLWLLNENE